MLNNRKATYAQVLNDAQNMSTVTLNNGAGAPPWGRSCVMTGMEDFFFSYLQNLKAYIKK